MLSFYKVSVTTENSKKLIKFQASSINDAYDIAASKIIDTYDDVLTDESCNILDNSSLKTWNEDCDRIYEDCGVNISDVMSYDNEENSQYVSY